MHKWLLLFISIFLRPAAAAEITAPAHGDVHIIQLDSDLPIEKLKNKNIHVHPLSAGGSSKETLPIKIQLQFFRDSNLWEDTKNWDALEKDRLALRTENQDPKEVAGKYNGTISEAKIIRLKSLIEEYRKHTKK